jgi:hypothetical protein
MKKWILLTAVCSLPLYMMAQDDDMYFVPTKENVVKEAEHYGIPKNTYYSGSDRSVDEYNGRLSSTVTPIDSLGVELESDDYQYTRQLSRFDDYSPSQAYWEGYRDGRWSSPWYYGRYGWYSTWYDPWYSSWYDPWYDPWYYDGYYGWTSSWRYGWYGSYYRPWGYYGYNGWHTPIFYYGGRGHHVQHSKSPSVNYYNRRNYSSNGTRRMSDGRRINVRSGNVGSGSRQTYNTGSYGSGSRSSSNSSTYGGSRSSYGGGSGMRSSGGGTRSGGGGSRSGSRR